MIHRPPAAGALPADSCWGPACSCSAAVLATAGVERTQGALRAAVGAARQALLVEAARPAEHGSVTTRGVTGRKAHWLGAFATAAALATHRAARHARLRTAAGVAEERTHEDRVRA
ncbi:uncharacterized protein LOC125947580 [Dermacentor silvarum]|uniref:uncharacterized protein LOC125947580 n=1 Tax=Dermacentor silvarum TaxID=543639 RepID=UPI002101A6BC|nr:uncharacterized protein LOC125947580 [Dermacentor silvarum]